MSFVEVKSFSSVQLKPQVMNVKNCYPCNAGQTLRDITEPNYFSLPYGALFTVLRKA